MGMGVVLGRVGLVRGLPTMGAAGPTLAPARWSLAGARLEQEAWLRRLRRAQGAGAPPYGLLLCCKARGPVTTQRLRQGYTAPLMLLLPLPHPVPGTLHQRGCAPPAVGGADERTVPRAAEAWQRWRQRLQEGGGRGGPGRWLQCPGTAAQGEQAGTAPRALCYLESEHMPVYASVLLVPPWAALHSLLTIPRSAGGGQGGRRSARALPLPGHRQPGCGQHPGHAAGAAHGH